MLRLEFAFLTGLGFGLIIISLTKKDLEDGGFDGKTERLLLWLTASSSDNGKQRKFNMGSFSPEIAHVTVSSFEQKENEEADVASVPILAARSSDGLFKFATKDV